jgi:hypothetical protein
MLWETRRQPGGPSHGHRLFARLADAADDNVVHHTGIEVIAVKQSGNGLGQKVGRMQFRERSTLSSACHG